MLRRSVTASLVGYVLLKHVKELGQLLIGISSLCHTSVQQSTYTCGLLVFSCIDINNTAFKFSPYLLPIVVHELLSKFRLHLTYFFPLIPIALEGWGHHR